MDIRWIGSPHKTKGRGGFRPEAVVVHIMEGSLGGTDAWFNDPRSRVSAHYGVGRDGTVHQYVHEADTAWHAGRTTASAPWPLRKPHTNPNRYTVGVEHEGKGDAPWPEAQLQASAALIREICLRWAIPMDRLHIIGHREIYPVKACPGGGVDLDRLVAMVREGAVRPLPDGPYNFVGDPTTVTTRVSLNVRPAPTTAAPVVRTERAGASLGVVGWTSNGENVSGNAHWYRLQDGLYTWAGGTLTPIPGLDGVGVVAVPER